MGEKALVDVLVDDAIKLITKLDELAISPTFVAWYYYVDADEWRLLLASPIFDPLFQKQEAVAYGRVIDALSKSSVTMLSVSDLKLVPTSHSLPQALKHILRTGSRGIVRARFQDSSFNQIFVKDVLVLRNE